MCEKMVISEVLRKSCEDLSKILEVEPRSPAARISKAYEVFETSLALASLWRKKCFPPPAHLCRVLVCIWSEGCREEEGHRRRKEARFISFLFALGGELVMCWNGHCLQLSPSGLVSPPCPKVSSAPLRLLRWLQPGPASFLGLIPVH